MNPNANKVLRTRFIVLEKPRKNHPLDPDYVRHDNYRTRNGTFSKYLNDAYLYKREPKKLPTWCKAVKATFVARHEMRSPLMVASNELIFSHVADFTYFRDWVGFGWVSSGQYTHLEDVPTEIPIVIDRPNF